jgi:hypothetical protein
VEKEDRAKREGTLFEDHDGSQGTVGISYYRQKKLTEQFLKLKYENRYFSPNENS